MTIFRNVVFLAALAGLLAGLSLAIIQHFSTVPLILQAETFEGSAPAHEHAADTPEHSHEQAAADTEEEEGWAPADGMERTTYTFLANIVTGIGFALLLVVVSELAGGIAGWRQGVFWGLAGFAVFTLAPGLGLPPELPAMPAADLGARQFWWVATVLATAVGLAMIAFRGALIWSVAGLALIVLPHVLGAPQPVDYTTPIPEGLHHNFVVAVTVTNLIFWVILGGLVGVLRGRWLGESASLQGRFA
jgi:cobalt transporter subunit CbtA